MDTDFIFIHIQINQFFQSQNYTTQQFHYYRQIQSTYTQAMYEILQKTDPKKLQFLINYYDYVRQQKKQNQKNYLDKQIYRSLTKQQLVKFKLEETNNLNQGNHYLALADMGKAINFEQISKFDWKSVRLLAFGSNTINNQQRKWFFNHVNEIFPNLISLEIMWFIDDLQFHTVLQFAKSKGFLQLKQLKFQDCLITYKSLEKIGQNHKLFQHIQHLSFVCCELGNEAVKIVAKYIDKFPNLKQLTLYRSQIKLLTTQDLYSIEKKCSKNFELLNLKMNNLQNKSDQAIAIFNMRRNSSYKIQYEQSASFKSQEWTNKWNLSQLSIQMQKMLQCQSFAKNVQQLDLSGNNFEDKDFQLFLDNIGSFSKLKSIKFDNNNIKNFDLKSLIKLNKIQGRQYKWVNYLEISLLNNPLSNDSLKSIDDFYLKYKKSKSCLITDKTPIQFHEKRVALESKVKDLDRQELRIKIYDFVRNVIVNHNILELKENGYKEKAQRQMIALIKTLIDVVEVRKILKGEEYLNLIIEVIMYIRNQRWDILGEFKSFQQALLFWGVELKKMAQRWIAYRAIQIDQGLIKDIVQKLYYSVLRCQRQLISLTKWTNGPTFEEIYGININDIPEVD